MAVPQLSSWTATLLLLLHLLTVTGLANEADQNLSIFFKPEQLKPGSTIPINFSKKHPSNTPHFLSKQQSDSIPFASAHLPSLLQLFSFPVGSPQAGAVETTLSLCELEPMVGETKFCATSLESMLDSVRSSFGSGTKPLKPLTTNLMKKSDKPISSNSVQDYTVLKEPEEILTRKVMGCHTMPYPYLVYFCHSPGGETKVSKVLLGGGGGGGEVVEAVAVCHMDTSKWDRDNPSFRVLGIEPGKGPVCHFLPEFDIVWADLGV
ncbi:BURP domain-containing protein BNM2C [Linum grandiflorum]